MKKTFLVLGSLFLVLTALAVGPSGLGLRSPAMVAVATPVVEDGTPDRTGLKLELIADTRVNEGGVDGSAVATWTDTSGENHHATQATSTQRFTLKTGIINGHAVMRADGVDDRMGTPAFAVPQPITLILVFSQATTSQMSLLGADGGGVLAYVNSGALAIYAGATVAEPEGATAACVATMVLSGESTTIRRNGVLVATGNAGNTGYAGGFAIGSVTFGGGSPASFNGDIAHVLVFDRALTEEVREAWENYLGTKYGITITHAAVGRTWKQYVNRSPERRNGWPVAASLARSIVID